MTDEQLAGIFDWGKMDLQRDQVARRFRDWGAAAVVGKSPLYGELCNHIAEDDDLLMLAMQRMYSQPPENMLFGAVHYLLLRGEGDDTGLRSFYPNLTESPQPIEEAFPHFRLFCLDHQDEILELIQTRRTQTNAVRRCIYLMPAYQYVANLLDGAPVAQIEFGCSAGLNLHWDRYSYQYGPHHVGYVDSPVKLTTEVRGEKMPLLGKKLPEVVSRVGLDLNPLDVTTDDDALWLEALVWPELSERQTLLRNAIAVMRANPLELLAGDGLALLPELAAQVPEDVPLLVSHSFVMYQLSAEQRQQFQTILSDIASKRPNLFAVNAGWISTPTPEVWLDAWQNGKHTRTKLANMDPHGRWIEWLAIEL